MLAIATQKLVPKLDTIAAFKRVRSRPILPQGIEYNLTDRLAGLTRQSARAARLRRCGYEPDLSRMFPLRGTANPV
jgi:hypothetical protein